MTKERVHLNIPVARFQPVLSWDQQTIDVLVNKAINLALTVGLHLDDDKQGVYLQEAQSKGARTESENHAVMFTRAQIDQTIEIMRRTTAVPDPLRPLSICENGREERFFVGNGANLLFDWDSWTAQPARIEDLVQLCYWAQGYDEVETFDEAVMPKDVDLRLEPIYAFAVMGKYCRKKVYHNQPTQPIHVRYLDQMARIVKRHRGFHRPMPEFEFLNPPFRLGRRAIETLIARVDSGICDSVGIGPMSVAGMSGPVSVAGAAVTALAEVLAALTFFNIIRPGYGLKTSFCLGALDMRTAGVSFFSSRVHLMNLAASELAGRGLGIDANPLTWYRAANEPGLQAAYEFGTATAFFSSILNRCSPELGGLSYGNVFSPQQAVIDIEAAKEFNEVMSGFEVELTDQALGIDQVVQARFEQGLHMYSEHTVQHMMEAVPFSNFFFNGLAAGAQHDKANPQTQRLMDRADQSVRESITRGREVGPDEELGHELYQCVKEAAAELGLEAPRMV